MKKRAKKKIKRGVRIKRGNKRSFKKKLLTISRGKLEKKAVRVAVAFNKKELEKYFQKELKILNKIAKKILEKRILKQIKSVKDVHGKLDALKHSLKSALDLKIHDLEKKLKKLRKNNKDVFLWR